jgi:hypothetical protein
LAKAGNHPEDKSMLSPRPVGPEQVLSPTAESSRDFMLARYTADVGPAQVDRTQVKVGDEWKQGIGVVFESTGVWGATWRAIVLDDGRLIPQDSVGESDVARHASCAGSGTAFVFEDRATWWGARLFRRTTAG